MRTIAEICAEAVKEIAVDPPTNVFGTSSFAQQLVALVNTTGLDLAKRGNWQELMTEATFTTVASSLQVNLSSAFPYCRKIVDNTMYNRTQQKRIKGSLSVQAWQRVMAEGVTPSDLYFRIRGNAIYFPGTPVADETVAFEYLDRQIYTTNDGNTPKERPTGESDKPKLPDELFVLGVRWRFLQKKGEEYGEVFREYEDMIENLLGNNAPQEALNLNPHYRDSYDLSDGNIPEGNWPTS